MRDRRRWPWLVAIVALVGLGEWRVAAWARTADMSALANREAIWLKRTRQMDLRTKPAEVVFLGDSTVERAIDDQLFEQRSRLAALNLGLTGDLGTYGDYAILDRYLKRFPPPRAVVVWHTIDVWGRDVDPQLFAFTEPGARDLARAVRLTLGHPRTLKASVSSPIDAGNLLLESLFMRVPSYRYRSALKTRLGLRFADPAEQLGQTLPRRVLDEEIRQLQGASFSVSPPSRRWFAALVELAQSRGIVVLAARSPLNAAFRTHPVVRPFVDESNRELTQLFASLPGVVQLNDDNPTFTAEQGYGDKDHVARGGQEYLSDYYARLVSQELEDGTVVR
jgi:hypothetical protein